MYLTRPNLILGFHGCEAADQQRFLKDISYFKKSSEDFDWLGHGMYFWENNPQRALLWAQGKKKVGNLITPAVIGAVIDLGHCFDLLDSTNISILKKCYDLFIKESEQLHKPIPKNKDHPKFRGRDRILRYLDCAVIQYTHKFLDENGELPFDSVRAAFIEGDPIYPDAGFAFLPFNKYLEEPLEKTVILRHDVDDLPLNSLKTTQIEHEKGIKGSCYFRIVSQSNKPEIMRRIAELGHEIGYHYEDLSLCKGNMVDAI